MFQRILICTDFADGLHRLTHFVPSLAACGIQQIVFLHTVPLTEGKAVPRPDGEKIERARNRLSTALQQVPAGVEVKIEVQSGKPTDHIFNACKAYKTELIVLGTSNRTYLNEKLFGSTTLELCQRLTIPVMTLRPQLVSTYTSEELDLRCRHLFRYFLIPYDGSNPSKYLIEQIKARLETRVTDSLKHCLLEWVIDENSLRGMLKDTQMKEAREKLAAAQADLEALGLQVETQVRAGSPIVETLNLANEYDISAIATSSGSLGKLIEWSVPSFTGELLRRSWHPVIYFPPGRG